MAISFCLVGKVLCGELCQNEINIKQAACQSSETKIAIHKSSQIKPDNRFLRVSASSGGLREFPFLQSLTKR